MNVSRVVAASATYDLLVTAPFATPWTARGLFALLARIHVQLGLSGPPPALIGTEGLLFTNLMGSIVVVWSVLRLRMPTATLGAADTAGRALFATWMLYALLHGGSAIILPLLLLEIGWGLVQGFAVFSRPATVSA